MSRLGKGFRACLFSTTLCLAAGFGGQAAFASDPLPGDSVAPPVNINIGLFYNLYSTAGEFDPAHGPAMKTDTHFSSDAPVARLIHTFSLGGYTAGIQVFEPYAWFLGHQQIGTSLPSAAPGFLPPIGAAKARYSAHDGFAQPNFGAFIFPINNPATDTYLVVGPWINPPVSSFDKNDAINPSQNVWVYEAEVGFHTMLLGTPKTQNLQLEVWGEAYLYGQNSDSADVGPTVTANNLPPIYPIVGVNNPIVAKSVTPATFREQPTEEFRVYLPYEFMPRMHAFIAPGYYQSFGGKQTYKIQATGEVEDSGNRTNESQLRLVAATFVAPNLQIMAAGYYDVAAHGAPLNRTFLVRLGVFF